MPRDEDLAQIELNKSKPTGMPTGGFQPAKPPVQRGVFGIDRNTVQNSRTKWQEMRAKGIIFKDVEGASSTALQRNGYYQGPLNPWLRGKEGTFRGMDPTTEEGTVEQFPKELPEGAVGWDAFGNPNFGGRTDFQEWQLQAHANLERTDQITEEEASWDDWAAPSLAEAQAEGGTMGLLRAVGAGVAETYKQTSQSLDYMLSGGDAEESTAQHAWRQMSHYAAETLHRAGSLAYQTKLMFGGLAHLAEEKFQFGAGVDDDPVHFTERWQQINDASDQFKVQRTPTELFWRNLGVSDETIDEYKQGALAGRMFYSTIWDNAVDSWRLGGEGGDKAAGNMKKEEFLREMKANPNFNPNVMVKKYENPAAEMWGEIIFDPLNVVEWGAKITKAYALRRTFAKLFAAPMGEVNKLLKGQELTRVSGLVDEAADIATMEKLLDARVADLGAVATKQTKLAKSKRVWQLTNSAKAHVMAQDLGQVGQWMWRMAKRADGKFDANMFNDIKNAYIKTAGDPAVAKILREGGEVTAEQMVKHKSTLLEGLNEIQKFPGWDIAFTEPGTRAAMFMGDAFTPGGIKKIQKLLREGKAQEAFAVADEFIGKATKNLFPDIVDDANKAKGGWKVLAKTHKYMQDGPYKMFNKFFSTVYLGLNPGFAARNFMQNTIQSLLDEGVRGAVGFNSLRNLGEWGADVTPLGAVTEFGTAAAGEAGHKVGRKVFGFIPTIGTDWAAKGEKVAGIKIYGRIFPKTMKQLFNKGLSFKELSKFGFTKDEATDIYRRMVQHKGDYNKVFDELAMEAKRGYIEVGQTTFGWTDEMMKWADDTGFTDPILQIMTESKTKQEAVDQISELFQQGWKAGDGVADDAAVLQADDIAADMQAARTTAIDQQGGEILKEQTLELNHYFGVNTEVWNTGLDAASSYRSNLAYQLQSTMPQVFPDAQAAKKFLDEALDGVKIKGTGTDIKRLFGAQPELEKTRRFGHSITSDAVMDGGTLRASGDLPKDEQMDLFEKLWGQWDMDNLVGPKPDVLTYDVIKEGIWTAQRGKVRPAWEEYRDLAATGYQQATEVWMKAVGDLTGELPAPAEMGEMVGRWKKAKLFDNFLDSREIGEPLARALRDGDRKQMAIQFSRMFRLPVFSENGLFVDDILLNTLNKQLKTKFKSLDDLNKSATLGPEQIELALMSQAIGETMKVYDTVGARGFANLRKLVAEGADEFPADDMRSILEVLDVVRHHDETLANGIEALYKNRDIELAEMARKGKRMSTATREESLNFIGEQQGKLDDLIDEAQQLLESNKLLEAPEWVTKKAGEYTPDDIQDALKIVEEANPDLFKRLTQADAARGMAGSRQQGDIAKFYDLEPHDLSLDASFQATAKAVKEADKAVEKVMKEVKELTGPNPQQFSVAEEAVKARRAALEEAGTFKPDMAYFSGENMPTTARQWYELRPNMKKFEDDFTEMANKMFGKKQPVTDKAAKLEKLKQSRKYVGNMTEESRAIANQVALSKRNFILHDYNKKRNFDLAMSYVMPYHFWYTRTYAAWLQRTVTHPGTMTAYLDYKSTLADLHADMPDWWKQNINTNELLGIDTENPLYFNLEQTLNPLNGLTGLDFDDKDKAYNWFSTMMQNAGKFGPSVYTPIAWAIAGHATAVGEDVAAAKWTGRTIPQTQVIKAITAKFGLGPGGSGLELDPGIWATSGGVDVWESRRIGRALGWAVDNGTLTREQAEQAAIEGPGNEYYDNARGIAQGKRSTGQISSFFLGAGFKGRTDEDLQIDKMDEEYQRFRILRPDMDHDQVVQAYRYFNDKYPFFSTLQIARRDEDEKDTAYAYSVLGRIPPGQTKEAYRAMGLTRDQVDEFYEAKAIPAHWSEREIINFNEAVQDVGTMLAIPSDATKDEWMDVGRLNKNLYERAEQEFGTDVVELVDAYWLLYGEDEEGAKAMREANPIIGEYQDYLSQAKLNHPLLAKYYASFDQLRMHTISSSYANLDKKYGPEFKAIYAQYNELKLIDSKQAKAFKKAHPEIAEYQDDKALERAYQAERLIGFADRLPDMTPSPEFRLDIPEPEARSATQSAIAQGFDQEETPEYFRWGRNEWEGYFTPALANLVEDWAVRNEELSYQAENSLSYQLRALDIDLALAKQLIRSAYQGMRAQP